ncbi:MAG: class I SAM-dependent methyltransferase [Steroidobacteraceae bacterium]
MSFKDHFSRQSAAYGRYRPGYPPELVRWVAAQAPGRRLAIDCATGNGQAAVALAPHFDVVLALDGSLGQLGRAQPARGVAYVAALAERLPVADRCADLVVAAQAAHWFHFDRHYAECRRVLAPGGAYVAWTYEKFRIDDRLDAVVDAFYRDVVGPYWPPERRYVEAGYRTLPFPWTELEAPSFTLVTHWDLATVLGYLGTWSSVQRYKDALGSDPVASLAGPLAEAWGPEPVREVRWPIHLRAGRA